MNEPMNEIIPGLYLGDIFAARNPSYLRDHGVTHILTIARGSLGLLSSTLESTDTEIPFDHRQIELDDLPDEKLLEQLENGISFIDSALSENFDEGKECKVLVHCLQGMSRSTSFVIAYLVWKNRITVGNALEIVQEKRKKARPNSGFYRQLLEWETRCKKDKDS
ncbi:dual specificity phosphatase 12 [Orbilia oligospora]|uniref:Dual specificity phosphatase 12 n=1 Tax=Orbilia oligospora TaxID=2813651 RepID=A0A7C8K947_ORBOL|nr:dual specificity phosphatase 12 [Orbilia oligospora]KAF3190415.1 dual specificity phosphatase 12 [Orbilia oligospora]KAF3242637.1 dual specificity phosphatase 12 [Orbilia oligospora]KAF3257971.1 dual specificity phosphatase 12 [Orbilia oligospora]KAF3286376.1 dual specificity phosphatase 12 [Orbilia oligospora]